MSTTALLAEGDWTVLRGPVDSAAVIAAATAVAERHQLQCHQADHNAIHLASPDSHFLVTVRWKTLPPQAPRTLGFQLPAPAAVEILIDPTPGAGWLAAELHDALSARALPYTDSELDGIRAAMPLLERYSTTPQQAFDGWALLFRDHYLEHSTGFVLAMERAGIPAEWIFTSAGIDRAGTEGAWLLPAAPDASARALRDALITHTGAQVAVAIADFDGRADRRGVTVLSIGAAGVAPLRITDHEGKRQEEALTDLIAAAAGIILGQRGRGAPAAVLRGISDEAREEGGVTAMLHHRP
ncbi:coenzyme F420-0:L-glutamate ligase [Streptomyces sp. TRM 70351]|uniref:coenzyme F420-0:L-glutamate ligase n=1 Tax=Streptomyces sp. TRM 70351 TaxID=3116552 RepID=UPI002E7B7D5D|nr:coenzyme F420-0:L-glutamate ligase [Streptomyces sp. TRM 70351]MEE1930664.1 coenzyme F420-0:L-glutamate ligase [Streptomyces sp. TRM 70351]